MSYAVFKTPKGTLYIKDFNTSGHRLELLSCLLECEDKIKHQDDLLCLLGSSQFGNVQNHDIELVASILSCRNADIIKNSQAFTDDLSSIDIQLHCHRTGFWTPHKGDNDEVVFLNHKPLRHQTRLN